MNQEYAIRANPIRVIPFDLGRTLKDKDIFDIQKYVRDKYVEKNLSVRQKSIIKKCVVAFVLNMQTTVYVYKNGMVVVSIEEESIDYSEEYETFSVSYDENRKKAHASLFAWNHPFSGIIEEAVNAIKSIVSENTSKNKKLRISAGLDFENRGLSYIMTLSMFDISKSILQQQGFKNYPKWLQNNVSALLEPAIIYLEDSSKFSSADDVKFDAMKILREIEIEDIPVDYERHKNIDTFMSWAAVVVIGQLLDTDKEDYLSLEVQLQSDWFYVYCLEKSIPRADKIKKSDVIAFQKQSYELDLLENRIYDFDDSSTPARVLSLQKGLIQTSGLLDNIHHLQREIRYLLEREQLDSDLKQRRIGQSTEILLFVIAYIQVAPTIAEYSNIILPGGGTIANIILIALGILLYLRGK